MRRLLTGLCALALPAALHAESIPPEPLLSAGEAAPETLNTGEGSGRRMTVPVMVNGQGPFQFIIDTGADRTVISQELAERLALPSGGKARLISMGGIDDIHTVKVGSLSVSKTGRISNFKAPALPEKYVGADGLLGVDTLKNHRIVLDFMQQTMTLEPSNNQAVRRERDPEGTIVVLAKTKLGQLVLVDADANGEDISVIVDTGGQNSVGNAPLRKLMMRGTSAQLRPVQLISVVGDRIDAQYALVGRMRIGGIKIGNAAVAFVDAHPFRAFGLEKSPAMLLGMDGLRAFRRVSIDFANKRVKFLLPQNEVGG